MLLLFSVDWSEVSAFQVSIIKETIPGHLKLKGTLIYALLEIESALSISDIPVP